MMKTSKRFWDIIPTKYRRAEPAPIVYYPQAIRNLSPKKIVIQ